jgi:AcrR family transcriptional regulator
MVRPRSARAHDSVLHAALQLFSERGIDATSMDAIAETSGVSKATIYKHWPDKEALCVEVMSHVHCAEPAPRQPDSGDIRADLLAILSHRPSERFAEWKTKLMPHMMAHAARNPAFAKTWQSRFFEPPRVELRRALERAIARGDLPSSLDIDLALALLLGPMLYTNLLKRMDREVPGAMLERVVEAFLKSYQIVRPQRKRP